MDLIQSDYLRYYQKPKKFFIIILLIKVIFVVDHRIAFQFWLRLASYPNLFRKFALIMWYHFYRKYHLEIPIDTVIGKGLYIGHGFNIIINHKTIIGENCSLSHCLTIGSNHDTPATIGNNVWIGPNVCIVENVKIGNNVKIGAGTIVINDIPDNSTSVGNPNRIIIKQYKQ